MFTCPAPALLKQAIHSPSQAQLVDHIPTTSRSPVVIISSSNQYQSFHKGSHKPMNRLHPSAGYGPGSSRRAGPVASRTGVRSMITAGVLVAPPGVAPHRGGTSRMGAKRAGESSTPRTSTPSKRWGSSSSATCALARIVVFAVCQESSRVRATREMDMESRARARSPHSTAERVRRARGWARAEVSCLHTRRQ